MMLEVKNLKKVYKIKNAAPVPALDDVSLKFPDTGLVFILGKSGSGKSTLLNVMGGLDLADSGEIVINGKSSKDFDSSEMDSYRNTYLGFIFQEYNILNDFTVRENIALALELQHKKPTNEVIDNILAEVDLVGYGRRKPNELSGGQKQRVAIARALVKEPKILFGDEPTGALDSATGLAVFETLKKLSKTRLVVVVSHDRDFAERFGDRVIELKDGKVISDITKITEEIDEANTGVSLYGSNLIRFERGHKLTKEDIELINKKLETTEEDAYFSIDSRINDSVSYAAMINENGQKESFIETDNELIEQRQEKWRVVKSKFPMSAAFRMGAKSLSVKPFRLVMTILLSFIAFAMFGLAVTFARVNKVSATVNSLEKSDEQLIAFGKSGGWGSSEFGEAFKKDLEAKTGIEFDVVGKFNANISTADSIKNSRYYASNFYGCIPMESTKASKYKVDLIEGKYPTEKDEIAITVDMYNTYKQYGIRDAMDYAKYLDASAVTENAIMGYTMSDYSSGMNFKIVGIVDTHLDMTPFTALKEASESSYSSELSELEQKLRGLRSSSLHCFAFVSQSYFDKYVIDKSTAYRFESEWNSMWYGLVYENMGASRSTAVTLFTDNTKMAFFDSSKTELNDGEVLIDLDALVNYYRYILGYEEESTINDSQDWTFSDVYQNIISGSDTLDGTFSYNTNWSEFGNAYQYYSYDNRYAYSGMMDLVRRLYAQRNYKGQNDGYQDPRVANAVYYNYESYGQDVLKQIFKTDTGNNLIQEERNGIYYYILDWTKIPTFYASSEPNANYIYTNIYNALCDNYDMYADSALTEVFEEIDKCIAEAKEKVYNTVLTTCPNALALKQISIYSSDTHSEFAKAHYLEMYEAYKDDTEMINLFKAAKGGTVVFDDDTKKEFAEWYLQKFVWKESIASSLDKTWYFNYLQSKVDTLAKDIQDGKISLSETNIDFTKKVASRSGSPTTTTDTRKVVGIFAKDYTESRYSDFDFFMKRSDIEAFAAKYMDLKFSTLIAPMPSGQKLTNAIKVYYDTYEAYDAIKYEDKTIDDFYYNLQSPLVSSIQVWVSLLSTLEKVFLYTGIAMAAFAMLLFYNFMSISINNKRREIGILRAVGARGVDVFKIFYSESAIIASINFVLATISLFIVGMVLNNKIAEAIPGLVLLKVGVVEILLVLAAALVASIISSILPVTKIARQKPIDAIREK